jgi:hypothetical protein
VSHVYFVWLFRTSSFWFRSGYLLRFFVMTAVGSGRVGNGELLLSRSSTSLEVKLQGSRFLRANLAPNGGTAEGPCADYLNFSSARLNPFHSLTHSQHLSVNVTLQS